LRIQVDLFDSRSLDREPDKPTEWSGADATTTDDVVKLAYEAVTASLDHDASAVESLRGRSTAVLSAATVMTAFVIGLDYHVGPTNSPLSFPTWAVYSLTAVLAIIAGCSTRVLWPIHDFAYGPSALKLLEALDSGPEPIAVVRRIANECQVSHQANIEKLKGRFGLFQLSEVMLVTEIGILIAVLLFAR